MEGEGIRDLIINLLNQPLVEPITMEGVKKWQEMVADQILAAFRGNKPFGCDVCGKTFKTGQARGAHIALTHKR